MYDTSALLLGQNSVAYQVGRDQRQSQSVPVKPSGINGRCKYRPRGWWQPGNNFPINAKDLAALRDTVAPKGGWTRTPLAPPRAKGELRGGGGGGTETDMRIQSSRAICSQISGLSFDAGCPSEAEASSSPCHQRRLRLWSNEGWWMRAVKQRLYGFCQGPPHRHRWLVGTCGPASGSQLHRRWGLSQCTQGKNTERLQPCEIFFCCLLQKTKFFEDPSGSLCFRRSRTLYQKCIMWCIRETFSLWEIKKTWINIVKVKLIQPGGGETVKLTKTQPLIIITMRCCARDFFLCFWLFRMRLLSIFLKTR